MSGLRRISRRTALAIMAGGALSVSATACGGGGTKTPSHAVPTAATVRIVNFTFDPMAVTVKVGGTVTWVQVDSVGHSVQSTDNAWITSAVLMPGQTFRHTFTQPGTYPYICGVHPYMTGTVTVVK